MSYSLLDQFLVKHQALLPNGPGHPYRFLNEAAEGDAMALVISAPPKPRRILLKIVLAVLALVAIVFVIRYLYRKYRGVGTDKLRKDAIGYANQIIDEIQRDASPLQSHLMATFNIDDFKAQERIKRLLGFAVSLRDALADRNSTDTVLQSKMGALTSEIGSSLFGSALQTKYEGILKKIEFEGSKQVWVDYKKIVLESILKLREGLFHDADVAARKIDQAWNTLTSYARSVEKGDNISAKADAILKNYEHIKKLATSDYVEAIGKLNDFDRKYWDDISDANLKRPKIPEAVLNTIRGGGEGKDEMIAVLRDEFGRALESVRKRFVVLNKDIRTLRVALDSDAKSLKEREKLRVAARSEYIKKGEEINLTLDEIRKYREAVLGGMAIDTKWNLAELQKKVDDTTKLLSNKMSDVEKYTNSLTDLEATVDIQALQKQLDGISAAQESLAAAYQTQDSKEFQQFAQQSFEIDKKIREFKAEKARLVKEIKNANKAAEDAKFKIAELQTQVVSGGRYELSPEAIKEYEEKGVQLNDMLDKLTKDRLKLKTKWDEAEATINQADIDKYNRNVDKFNRAAKEFNTLAQSVRGLPDELGGTEGSLMVTDPKKGKRIKVKAGEEGGIVVSGRSPWVKEEDRGKDKPKGESPVAPDVHPLSIIQSVGETHDRAKGDLEAAKEAIIAGKGKLEILDKLQAALASTVDYDYRMSVYQKAKRSKQLRGYNVDDTKLTLGDAARSFLGGQYKATGGAVDFLKDRVEELARSVMHLRKRVSDLGRGGAQRANELEQKKKDLDLAAAELIAHYDALKKVVGNPRFRLQKAEYAINKYRSKRKENKS